MKIMLLLPATDSVSLGNLVGFDATGNRAHEIVGNAQL